MSYISSYLNRDHSSIVSSISLIYIYIIFNPFIFSFSIFFWASQVVIVVKNLPTNERVITDASSIPGLGRYPGGGHGKSLECSCLENPMGTGAQWAIVHRVAKNEAWLKRPSTHTQGHEGRTPVMGLVFSVLIRRETRPLSVSAMWG